MIIRRVMQSVIYLFDEVQVFDVLLFLRNDLVDESGRIFSI